MTKNKAEHSSRLKDRIRSAQIVLPCANLNRALEFYVEQLGFRVEMIFPADAPSTAVLSGYGMTLRLEETTAKFHAPAALRLEGDFDDEISREIFSPDGVRIRLVDAEPKIEIPVAAHEFVLTAPDDDRSWSEGRAGMLYRDLIPNRLGGRFVASHIRIPRGGAVPDYVHYHKIRFQMIYCLAGWVRVVYQDQGEPFLMRAGDCVLQPPEIRHRVLESSANLEVLEIGCPAAHETCADHQMDLPNDRFSPERIFGGQRFVRHIAENASWEKAKVEALETRDTGIAEATNDLADVRVFRAVRNSRFSVRHSGEFLYFFILKGILRLTDAAGKSHPVRAGGSFVLPKDTDYFFDVERELEMLRVRLPAR